MNTTASRVQVNSARCRKTKILNRHQRNTGSRNFDISSKNSDGDTCIGRTCCRWSTVITSFDAIHPGAVAIQLAAIKAGGVREGGASNSCIDNAASVAVVIEVCIDQHILEGNTVLADL